MTMTQDEQEALERLFKIAKSNTDQSHRCANFLLAWWNASSCGGFDFAELWMVDRQIADDMLAVAAVIARTNSYTDSFAYRAEFEEIVRLWRPNLTVQEPDVEPAS